MVVTVSELIDRAYEMSRRLPHDMHWDAKAGELRPGLGERSDPKRLIPSLPSVAIPPGGVIVRVLETRKAIRGERLKAEIDMICELRARANRAADCALKAGLAGEWEVAEFFAKVADGKAELEAQHVEYLFVGR